MGEKEQAVARESSAPSISERAAGTRQITGDPDFDTGSTSRVRGSKSNTSEREAGTVLSPDVDLADSPDGEAAMSGIVKSKSNITNNRETAPDADDDGTLDESAAAVVKTKTKSNQSNDRLRQDDDSDGSGAVEAAINNTKSNIKNRLGGGDSAGIAVSDEGVPADRPSNQ